MNRYALGLTAVSVLLAGTAYGQTDSSGVVWRRVADTGVLFVTGERVEPPYVFVVERDTLRVNGRAVLPVCRDARGETVVTETVRARHGLLTSCLGLCESLLEEGQARPVMLDSVLAMLETSPWVESATVHGSNAVHVRWKDGPPWEEYVMIPTEQQLGPAPWFEICRRNAERYTRHLSRGHIVIVGASGEMILPHGRIGELEYELELLERFQDAGAEELEILSADFAREFLKAQD